MERITTNFIERFIGHLPFNTTDPVVVVLKGHLLCEELLREYVFAHVARPQKLSKARLTFHQYLSLAQALSIDDKNEKLWLAIKRLNDLRNAFAHQLEDVDRDKKVKQFTDDLTDYRGNSPYMDPHNFYGVLATCVFTVCMSLVAAVNTVATSAQQ